MDWSKPTKPTTRPAIVAAIQDTLRAYKALDDIVGKALPAEYSGPSNQWRDDWGVQLRWVEDDLEIKVVPPAHSYYSYSLKDLQNIKERLCADYIYIVSPGDIVVRYHDQGEDHAENRD